MKSVFFVYTEIVFSHIMSIVYCNDLIKVLLGVAIILIAFFFKVFTIGPPFVTGFSYAFRFKVKLRLLETFGAY